MYAKVFESIFNSSLADDYELRHFFMDLLVLADMNGLVDMTPGAIAGRTRIPIEKVTDMLRRLELPDAESRNSEHSGKRIERIDEHRSWGWYIVNFAFYHTLAKARDLRERGRERMERHRTKVKNTEAVDVEACNATSQKVALPYACTVVSSVLDREIPKGERFVKPSIETVKLHGIKIGLPPLECEKFFDYYEANGWRVGRNPMKMWTSAMANWKRHSEEYGKPSNNGHQSRASLLMELEYCKQEWNKLQPDGLGTMTAQDRQRSGQLMRKIKELQSKIESV